MKYAIITGVSRGLGASISEYLMENGFHIIGVARSTNEQLADIAEKNGVTYHHEQCNLSNQAEVEQVFHSIKQLVNKPDTEMIHLINNAGTVEPIEQAGKHDLTELTNHVHINLLTPMTTTNLMLQMAREVEIPVIITNVTSGAANRPVYGWSAYCGTKLGLNRFTETVALEQTELGTNNKVILFDPGKMDTKMQEQIRSANESAFKDVEKYKQFKQNDSLRDTNVVAQALVDILKDVKTIENGKLYNIKDLV